MRCSSPIQPQKSSIHHSYDILSLFLWFLICKNSICLYLYMILISKQPCLDLAVLSPTSLPFLPFFPLFFILFYLDFFLWLLFPFHFYLSKLFITTDHPTTCSIHIPYPPPPPPSPPHRVTSSLQKVRWGKEKPFYVYTDSCKFLEH